MRRLTRAAATVLAAAATATTSLVVAGSPAVAEPTGFELSYGMSTPVHGLTRTVQYTVTVQHDLAVPAIGTEVGLWARPVGSARWTEVAHAATNASGRVTLTVRGQQRATDYQVRVPGDAQVSPVNGEIDRVAGGHTRRCLANVKTRVTSPSGAWRTRTWSAPIGTGIQACQAPRGIPTTARAALHTAMRHHRQPGTWHAVAHTRWATELVSAGQVIGYRISHVKVTRIARHKR